MSDFSSTFSLSVADLKKVNKFRTTCKLCLLVKQIENNPNAELQLSAKTYFSQSIMADKLLLVLRLDFILF